MDRPPIGKVAMTGAERVRRYRQKHGANAPVTKPVTKQDRTDDTRVRELEARTVELTAQLAHARIEHAAAGLVKAAAEP
jgi:hypothetical protein